jgi:sugar lactone lactonase YvrE
MTRKNGLIARGRLLLLAGLLLALGLPSAAVAQAPVFPEVIELPIGFSPEGIAVGRGTSFYVGSLADGSVFGGDLRAGEGDIVVPAQTDRIAVGVKVDTRTNYLFVAGGPGGAAYIYDIETGAEVATVPLALPDASFINDVVVTRDAAYFTNSFAPYFYKLPLGPDGQPADPAIARAIMLTGAWEEIPGGFNSNGIAATPNGKRLIIVNSTTGKLYRVDPANGGSDEIDLGGASLTAGDGLLLDGKTLYVVRNQFNEIVAIRMAPDFASGTVVKTITNPNFDVPTTIAAFSKWLYAVNAKFGTPPEGTPYEVIKVAK